MTRTPARLSGCSVPPSHYVNLPFMGTQFEGAIERLTFYYQRTLREFKKKDSEYLKTPSKLLGHELSELKGELKGLGMAIDVLEEIRNDNNLLNHCTDIH